MAKNRIMIILLMLLLPVLSIGATIAYMSDGEQTHNVVTVGHVHVRVIEEFDPGSAILIPGEAHVIPKVVSVRNDGKNPAWARVKIFVPSELTSKSSLGKDIIHLKLKDGYETDWEEEEASVVETEDGYYTVYTLNLKNPLETGKTSSQLLEGVFVDGHVDRLETGSVEQWVYREGDDVTSIRYDLGRMSIYVQADAIQEYGFADSKEAFDAFDKQRN